MIKTPEAMNNGRNMPVQAAIAAKPPPRASEPVSPMNTRALYLFCVKNPMHAPAIDAPKTPRSVCTKACCQYMFQRPKYEVRMEHLCQDKFLWHEFWTYANIYVKIVRMQVHFTLQNTY